MKRKHTIITALAALVITGCASGHQEPYTKKMDMKRDLRPFMEGIRSAVDSSPQLTITDAGKVEYPGFSATIAKVTFKGSDTPAYRVFLSGGVHGNEPAGAQNLARFIELLAKNPSAYRDYHIDIVPLVNPWGYTFDMRRNRDGRDINRDFASGKTQEARIIQKVLEDQEYDLVIDFHEDPDATGFYVYQYGMDNQELLTRLVGQVTRTGFPMEENVNMIILKTKKGIIDAPLWGLWYMWVTRQLSLSNYQRLWNSTTVYTVETPTSQPMEKRLAIQHQALAFLLSSIVTPSAGKQP